MSKYIKMGAGILLVVVLAFMRILIKTRTYTIEKRIQVLF